MGYYNQVALILNLNCVLIINSGKAKCNGWFINHSEHNFKSNFIFSSKQKRCQTHLNRFRNPIFPCGNFIERVTKQFSVWNFLLVVLHDLLGLALLAAAASLRDPPEDVLQPDRRSHLLQVVLGTRGGQVCGRGTRFSAITMTPCYYDS